MSDLLERLIAEGEHLAPLGGGDVFAGPNPELQDDYAAWRTRCVTLLRDMGPDAGRLMLELKVGHSRRAVLPGLGVPRAGRDEGGPASHLKGAPPSQLRDVAPRTSLAYVDRIAADSGRHADQPPRDNIPSRRNVHSRHEPPAGAVGVLRWPLRRYLQGDVTCRCPTRGQPPISDEHCAAVHVGVRVRLAHVLIRRHGHPIHRPESRRPRRKRRYQHGRDLGVARVAHQVHARFTDLNVAPRNQLDREVDRLTQPISAALEAEDDSHWKEKTDHYTCCPAALDHVYRAHGAAVTLRGFRRPVASMGSLGTLSG